MTAICILFLGTYDCSVNIWSHETGTKLASGLTHTEPVKSIAWIHASESITVKLLSSH